MKNRTLSRLLMLLVLLAGSAASRANDSLGRLFFTPERRATLERQRQFNIQEATVVQGSVVSLDGVIRRSDGDRTFWLNGKEQHNGYGTPGLTATEPGPDPARANVNAEGEASTSLKVGQSFNRATGEKQDGLGGGTLFIRKSTVHY